MDISNYSTIAEVTAAVRARKVSPVELVDATLARVEKLEEVFPGEIPRPDYWRGYVLRPERVEFWKDGAGRLHDRILFSRSGDAWLKERLFP